MAVKAKRPTDWRKRFDGAKPPKNVVLHTDFAGIKTGTTMHIASPGTIANFIARIPVGETCSIERMRNELARKHDAQAACPVTTAIYLKVVAEVALMDLAEGKVPSDVVPFWRVIAPDSKIAKRLSCDSQIIEHYRLLEQSSGG
ncbi:MGMT family protein [Candidatus Phycosocius spiralis]|uniref:Uncharacterized protein n=1 Tax=Candidatus Phycosocius spiralis TaxID=2815099 RepID=A0ABQ4PT25_9PROT|nr:MGMT family protein [Candidatus Phycosocius spiralis]GIU66132.1 hypothetical protein PsB1_0286 [Candidatus Phycosocius spiralis]